MGMITEKDYKDFLQQFCWFYSSAVLQNVALQQLQLGASKNCEFKLPLKTTHLLNGVSLYFRRNEVRFILIAQQKKSSSSISMFFQV